MQGIVIIRGLPGSGKTTMAEKLDGYVHCEADQYFMNDKSEYVYDRTKIRDAHKWCYDKAKRAVEQGQSVVVSNTFTTRVEMLPYLKLAKESNIEVDIIVLKADYGSVHDVPKEVIKKMADRWED